MSVPYATSDDELGWFVTLVEDGRVIGDAGTKGGADDEGRIEIGYGLAAPFRGKGYGTEAVRLLVDHLGSQPGVRVVTAEVEVGNVASRKLLERIGFTLTHEADKSWWFERPAGS
jgi:RimJ/RimL family protein N-acetyltransferase